MYYLSNINGEIGFKIEGIHNILATDVPITDVNYANYFAMQTLGNEYTIKDINGINFDDIFQIVVQPIVVLPKSDVEINTDRITAIETTVLGLMLAGLPPM